MEVSIFLSRQQNKIDTARCNLLSISQCLHWKGSGGLGPSGPVGPLGWHSLPILPHPLPLSPHFSLPSPPSSPFLLHPYPISLYPPPISLLHPPKSFFKPKPFFKPTKKSTWCMLHIMWRTFIVAKSGSDRSASQSDLVPCARRFGLAGRGDDPRMVVVVQNRMHAPSRECPPPQIWPLSPPSMHAKEQHSNYKQDRALGGRSIRSPPGECGRTSRAGLRRISGSRSTWSQDSSMHPLDLEV